MFARINASRPSCMPESANPCKLLCYFGSKYVGVSELFKTKNFWQKITLFLAIIDQHNYMRLCLQKPTKSPLNSVPISQCLHYRKEGASVRRTKRDPVLRRGLVYPSKTCHSGGLVMLRNVKLLSAFYGLHVTG